MRTLYKVVTMEDDGSYASIYAPEKYKVVYEVCKESLPPIGALFCFETMAHAMSYLDRYLIPESGYYRLLVGKGKYSPYQIRSEPFSHTDLVITQFWENIMENKKLYPFGKPLALGTVIVSSFIPLQIIDPLKIPEG
jgi:hypothetical protein